MNSYRVFLVYWLLKLDPEAQEAIREVGAAKAAVKRWCHPAFYGRRMIGFIVVTDESALELAKRLNDETKSFYWLENVHVLGAPQPDDIACAAAGTFGPLNHWVRQGWIEARKRNGSNDVRRAQRR
jgi:hypothetical protein